MTLRTTFGNWVNSQKETIGMSDSGEWWMVSDKTRSNTDTEQVKEEGDWAFRQQFLERIDADLDKEKKEQMLELLWVQ